MKIRFVLLCLLVTAADADFNNASNAYAEQQYEQAFKEFQRLAKLGNKRAQFNIGVMYLNGEFVAQDLPQAYAWGKLSEHEEHPEFSQIRTSLEKQFNAEELLQASATFGELSASYGDAQIYAKLSPIAYQSKDQANQAATFKVNTIKRKAPFYPKEALSKGIQGWVTVGFEIFPDGSTRHPYVIESFPENLFDQVTLEAISGFKFALDYDTQVEPHPVMATQTIEYQINTRNTAGTQKRLKQLYQERLERLKNFADQGSARAQYVYAIAGSANLIPKVNRIPATEVNQWLLKSAQNGHVQAQYHLGRNILRGKGCQVEKQKGIDWIVYAAEQGHPKSSRLAYRLLTQQEHLNNTDKPAEHWLKMAAKNGDPEAQLDYAHHLVFAASNATQHTEKALELLNQYRENRNRSVKYYQVLAQIHHLSKQDKKASKAQNKADKLAKKLGWAL